MAKFNHLKLAAVPPPRSPQRIALSEAIERCANAQHTLDHTKALLDSLEHKVWKAREAADLAAAALAKHTEAAEIITARENADLRLMSPAAAAALTDAARAAAAKLSADPRALREQAQAADDTLAALVAQRAGLGSQREGAARAVEFAKMKRDNAVRDVVKADPSVRKLLAAFIEAHRDLVSLRRALQFLDGKSMIPDDARSWPAERDWPDLPGASAWQAAVRALESDADAPLPE